MDNNKIIPIHLNKNFDGQICKMCGSCCFLLVDIEIEGKKFVPAVEKCEEMLEIDKIALCHHVCESFDIETKECKDYENRPESCKKFFCKGNPQPQKLHIKGKRE